MSFARLISQANLLNFVKQVLVITLATACSKSNRRRYDLHYQRTSKKVCRTIPPL